jgi:FkbM family methyltransferase
MNHVSKSNRKEENSPQGRHWRFTYNQWGVDEKHYLDVVEHLAKNKITSYVDLGANTGGVCSVLLEKIETLEKCYLFEPQTDNFNFMRDVFQSDERVICYNSGILYTDKKNVNLFRCDNNVGGYTAIKFNEDFNLSGDQMEVRRLEDFNFSPVDFMKIDVEGSEENIILNSTFLKEVKFIELELHERLLDKKISIEFLRKNMESHSIIYDLSHFPHHVFLQKIK